MNKQNLLNIIFTFIFTPHPPCSAFSQDTRLLINLAGNVYVPNFSFLFTSVVVFSTPSFFLSFFGVGLHAYPGRQLIGCESSIGCEPLRDRVDKPDIRRYISIQFNSIQYVAKVYIILPTINIVLPKKHLKDYSIIIISAYHLLSLT